MSSLNPIRTILVVIFMVLWFLYGGAIITGIAKEGFDWLSFVGIPLTVVNMLAFIKKTNILIKIALAGNFLILLYAFVALPIYDYSYSMILVGVTSIYLFFCLDSKSR